MKEMSVTEYAKRQGITRQAILKRLHPEVKPLIDVVSVKKIGNNWVLKVKQ